MATGHWCGDCDALVDTVRVYECDSDGWRGDERQCEQCKKFAALASDQGCEVCFAEVEEIEVVTDHDGAIIRAEDYVADGKSLADRMADEKKALDKEFKARKKVKLDTVLKEATETTWGAVTVGQKIVKNDWKGEIDTLRSATVLSITTVGEDCKPPLVPGSLIVLTEQYGLRLEVHSLDEPVLIKDDAEEVPSPADRFKVEVGSDSHSSGVKLVSANVALASSDGRDVYIGEINGRNSPYANFQTLIGAFHLPEEAKAFAAAAREAAELLRSRILFDGEQPLTIELTESDDILSYAPIRYAEFLVGTDDMLGGEGVRVETRATASSSQSYTVLSPVVLEGIAVAADMIAEKLASLIGLKVQ